MKIALAATLLLITLAAGIAPAWAKDFEEEGRVRDAEALCEKLAKLRAAKDRQGLEAAQKEAPALHNALKTKTAMTRLQKAIAAVLDDEEQNVMTRLAAIDTLAALHDEKGVWKLLQRHMPDTRDEAVGQIGLKVVSAVGEIAPDAAIGSLETLSRSAGDVKAAETAITALGRYGYSKQREKVLKSLMSTLTRLRPGVSRDRRGRPDAQRYNTLSGALVDALNRLTGRREEGVELWLELYKDNKKDLGKLFRYER